MTCVPVGLAETVQWVGATTGDWDDPANWSSGALPAAADDVVVDVGSPVFVVHAVGDTQVSSLTLTGTLRLSGGSFTVTQLSQITGHLIIDLGASLTASGAGATFAVTDGVSINGGDVIAVDGGTVLLPESTQHSGSGLLSAQGIGSRILANLVRSIPPPPPNLSDAVSRAVSVYQGEDVVPAPELKDTVSRAVSVYQGQDVGPAPELKDTVSRAVSAYQGPADVGGDPAADLQESVSRAVSVRHE